MCSLHQDSCMSLANTDASLSRHLADTSACQAEFQCLLQRVMVVIDVKTENSAPRGRDRHGTPVRPARAYECARRGWAPIDVPPRDSRGLTRSRRRMKRRQNSRPSRRGTSTSSARAGRRDATRIRGRLRVRCASLMITEHVRHDGRDAGAGDKAAGSAASNHWRRRAHGARSKTCSKCTATLPRAIVSWRTARPSVAARHCAPRESVSALCPSCVGLLWSIGCMRTLRMPEGERHADVERQTESMQQGQGADRGLLRAVLCAAAVTSTTEQRCAVEDQQAEQALRARRMRAVDVQV